MDCLKAKARREELQYMSYRDMLTTLYNRNKYIQVVDSAQGKTVRRTGGLILILMVSIRQMTVMVTKLVTS